MVLGGFRRGVVVKKGGGIVESGKHGRCRRCSSRFCVCGCRNGTACMYVHVMHCVISRGEVYPCQL